MMNTTFLAEESVWLESVYTLQWVSNEHQPGITCLTGWAMSVLHPTFQPYDYVDEQRILCKQRIHKETESRKLDDVSHS